jgi:amidophosphoribosyltransferase
MGGFFGTVLKKDCAVELYYGIDYHSHLGTRRGGMAVVNDKGFSRSIHNLENAYFRTKFESDLKDFRGNSGIGVISDNDAQPIVVNSHLGKFAIVTVGRINNISELEGQLLAKNRHFSEWSRNTINPTELTAMLICEENSFPAGIERVFHSVKGSCSMLILTEKGGIYAARDKLGRTPLIIGKSDVGYALASESISFANLGFSIEKYIGPGEIIYLTAEGYEPCKPPENKMQICSFLWVYYGYPASLYEGIGVDSVRYRTGAALAKNDLFEVDAVSGIPDSGIGHAIGYSNQRKIPYVRAFVKYTPTWPRSFMPQDQSIRNLVAKMKLIPNQPLVKDKRLVFCEDSIVRGTQLLGNIQVMKQVGALEVHMRVACPTLLYSCDYLNFSMSKSILDLAGRRAIKEIEGKDDMFLEEYAKAGSERHQAMVDHICSHLELNSLQFQNMSDLIEAIGLPKEKLCTHCWDCSSYF